MRVTKQKIVQALPPCTQSGCTTPARFALVWAREVAYCPEHTVVVLNVAEAMGFITPAETIAIMITLDEVKNNVAFAAVKDSLGPMLDAVLGDLYLNPPAPEG
jgi:hypothetical protein